MSSSQQFINTLLYPKKSIAETISGQWTFKHANNDTPALIANVTDTSGFARVQEWQLNNAPWMYAGTIFGFNGIVNLLNNIFFFGNSDALYYLLMNPASGVFTMAINGGYINFGTTSVDFINRNLTTSGQFTDGSTGCVPAHAHLGTAGQGAIIPHVRTAPARNLATNYTNSSARPIIVTGDLFYRDNGAGTGWAYFDCKSDTSSTPTTITQKVGDTGAGGMGVSEQIHAGFYFVVQPGHKYRIDSTSSNATVGVGRWNEIDF